MITAEQWRKIFLDLEAGHPELEGIDTGERFFPLRSAKGLSSAEHFARYLFAAGFGRERRVLDAACGPGYGAYILKLQGAREVVGVDRDERTIEFARRRYGAEGIHFCRGDATTLRRDGPPFDLIACFETLEHVEDPGALLEALRGRLAPDGLLILSCPHDARSPWVSPFHLRHYTYQEFHDLVARFFPEPLPVAQIHGIASLILPQGLAAADDLAAYPLPEAYFDVAKPVESSDVFLLLCGRRAVDPRPVAVISKNLTDLLREIYSAVSYLRERAPRVETELADARARLERQTRQLGAVSRALEDQKGYTLELEYNLEEMRRSRSWQLTTALREALDSVGSFLRLPGRIARILIEPPVVPVPAQVAEAASALLPRYRPHRRSAVGDWPADRPLVTVGIPCFNYGRFLREAIDSVLASTFQDLEIIVVNDGSTDPETLAVLRGLGSSDRLRVADQPNQGLAASRNKGAALARGKYVISLDADDRIDATYLEKAVGALERDPSIGFCYPLVQTFGAEKELWETEPFDLEKCLQNNHVATAAVFRREAWVEAGGFRDGLCGQDDWNFWLTLGAHGWKGHFLKEPLFHYRKHAASMWSQLNMEERERTAQRVRSMHAYLLGQGDSREAEAFGRPADPVVRAALDHPEPPPPGDRRPLAQRPHLAFGDGRPALLFAIPWMSIGGAEQVVMQVMRGLSSSCGVAVVTTIEARHDWAAEFARITPWIYHLARLPIDDPARYLHDLITAHGISGLIISGSATAYQALPSLKTIPGLWTADIVHNIVPEGYLETSIQQDRWLDCHFAVGGPQRDALAGRGRVAAGKIRLAPTSADAMARFHPATYAARLPEIRHQLGLKGNEIVLTYTGRLAVEKDVPLFVRVVGHLVRAHPGKKFQAFLVGDGPERARVEHEIRTQGLQGIVEILGFTDQVAEVLAVSHFSFLTSRFEGSSVTLLEAMSMRQVVVVADVGNVRDVVENGGNGFVVSTREPADFAAPVSQLLDDPAREAEMRERARRTILEHYELAAMVRVYADAVADAFARRRSTA